MRLALLMLSPAMLSFGQAFYFPGVNPRSFAEGEQVKLKVNKLTSTKTLMPRDYYTLPFCAPPGGAELENQNLGQFLAGDRIESSPYYLEMKKDMYCEQLCIANLGRAELPNVAPNRMVKAIRKNYHNNWIVDNMSSASKMEDEYTTTTRYWQGFPIGFIAEDTKISYVHNHVNIEIMYHPVENEADKYRVVRFTVEPFSIAHDFDAIQDGDAYIFDEHTRPLVATIKSPIESCASKSTKHTDYDMVTAVGRQPQVASGPVLFTYDVIWIENRDLKWASRWDVYLNMDNQIPDKVHWLSIANSLLVVVMLSAVNVAILSRSLRRNLDVITNGSLDEESLAKMQNESGWKSLHADVFRPPCFSPMLLAACCGTGSQLLFTSVFTIVLGALGFLSSARRGHLLMAVLLSFTFFGAVNGYVSARLYKAFTGKSRSRVTVVSALSFPGFAFGAFLVADLIALWNQSTYAVPFMTVLILVILIFGISAPLAFAGAKFGFNQATLSLPTRTSPIPRPIPDQSLVLSAPVTMLASGILPFSTLFVELYYIMASMWMEFYYYSFGFLLMVFILLLLTCAEITVLFHFQQLCKEDHRWWWRSFVNSGAGALYVFAYSVVYFQQFEAKALSTHILYFGYMAIVSLALFLLMGSVGVAASLWFNKALYASIKAQVEQGLKPLLQESGGDGLRVDEAEES